MQDRDTDEQRSPYIEFQSNLFKHIDNLIFKRPLSSAMVKCGTFNNVEQMLFDFSFVFDVINHTETKIISREEGKRK